MILPQLIANGIIAGSMYALMAAGFSLVYRMVGFLHLAHGGVYVAGAYAAYALFALAGLPFSVALLGAIIISVLIGVAMDQVVYKSLRQRHLSGLALLLASLALFIFIQSLVQMLFGADVKTLRLGEVTVGLSFLGAIITPTQISIVATAVAVLAALAVFLKFTPVGREMRAVADNANAARLVGINPENTVLLTFTIGSALAGLAGVLVGLESNLEPTMGFIAILKAMTASVVGGIDSVAGGMLGGYLIGLIENFGIAWLPSGYKDAIAFVILIVFLLLRPQGILGLKRRSG